MTTSAASTCTSLTKQDTSPKKKVAKIVATYASQASKKKRIQIPKKNTNRSVSNTHSYNPKKHRGRGRDRGRVCGRGKKRKAVSQEPRKSYSKVKRLNLTLDIIQVFHMDEDRQRSYFEGPYVVEADREIVGEGKLLCYKKGDIAYEPRREIRGVYWNRGGQKGGFFPLRVVFW